MKNETRARKRQAKRTAVVGAGVAGMMGFTLWAAPSALADSEYQLRSCGPASAFVCGRGGIYSSNTWAYACDLYADGAGFQTVYRRADGTENEISDPNGSASGCGSERAGTSANRVTSYIVCVKKSPRICGPRVWL
ncbi:hypothetical protein ACH4D5_21105 [Streptomyces sp. NPDC018029]|uniref:hypothetical protein n=1 Tax=Streptomyces sp. NPDC018029 TaxID=3365032 RepID=UPI00378CD638